jgi:pimeloyl-ACP methyl ester carboxylesterase
VGLDRRGIGLSDPPAGGAPGPGSGPGDWAADALAACDAAGLARPVVLANADTCLAALALAAAHPDRVAALVLVHPYPRYVRGDGYPYGVDPVAATAVSTDVLRVDGDPGDGERFDPLGHIAPSVARDPAFRAWWDATGRRAAGPGAAAVLHAVVHGADVRALLPRVRAHTLLVHRRACGSYDPGHARYLEAQLPDARVVTLPGADELWFTGGAGAVVELVTGLLSGPRAPR